MGSRIFVRINSLLILILFFCAFICDSSYAEFRLDPFKVTLSPFEGVGYNSNPGYASKRDKDHGFTNQIGADLGVELPFGRLHRYTWNSHSYWNAYFYTPEYNQFNNTFTQSVDLIFNKWQLNIHQYFDNSQEPTLQEKGFLDRGFWRRITTTPGFRLQGDMGKIKPIIGFDYTYYSANETYKIMDNVQYTPYVELDYALTERISGILKFTYTNTQRHSCMMNNSNSYDLRAGLRGEITPYLVGEVDAGYEVMKFEKKPNNSDESDYSSYVGGLTLTNRISRLTTQQIRFAYEPEIGFSEHTNYYKSISTEYTVNHSLNSKINLNGSVGYLNINESGSSYERARATVWDYGLGISYAIMKNLTLATDYDYSEKTANRHGKGYRQHLAAITAKYTF